jgi:hypothetical protein
MTRHHATTDLSIAYKENIAPKHPNSISINNTTGSNTAGASVLKRADSMRTKRKNVTWNHQSSDTLTASAMMASAVAGTSGGLCDALSLDGEADVPNRTIDSIAAQHHQRILATPHKSPRRVLQAQQQQQQLQLQQLQQQALLMTPSIDSASSGSIPLSGMSQASGGTRLSFGGDDDIEVSPFSPYKPPSSIVVDSGEPSAKRRPMSYIIPRKPFMSKIAQCNNDDDEIVDNNNNNNNNNTATNVDADDNDATNQTKTGEADTTEDEVQHEVGSVAGNSDADFAAMRFVRSEPTDKLHNLRLPTRLESGMNTITPAVLAQVLSGEYNEHYDRVIVLDCRFRYEYVGGHVQSAVHVPTLQDMEQLLQENPPTENGERVCIVFHCEFSKQRGPSLYRALRSWDRGEHSNCYPQLYYPEIYLLKGGYKQFYCESPQLCEPQAYQPMWDSTFKCEMGDGLRTNKVNRRAKSFNAGDHRALRRSLKW